MVTTDTTLFSWDDMLEREQWSGILLGNGASRAVWERFDYQSLFDVARFNIAENPLSRQAVNVFNALSRTRDFEHALRALSISGVVNESLGLDHQTPLEIYGEIRQSLVEAVRSIHPPHALIPDHVKRAIRESLLGYDWVYTTNYDLLLYWAVMAEPEGAGFKDFFWSEPFDITNTEVSGSVSRLLYLHGALHIERRANGATSKRVHEPGLSLLESFQTSQPGMSWPLFVSEGTAKDKMRAIRNSDYLTFAYQSLAEHEGPLVVFGQSLSDSDRHLIDAINRAPTDTVAVSVRTGEGVDLQQRMYAQHASLHEKRLLFFEAQTFPLGSENLRVPVV